MRAARPDDPAFDYCLWPYDPPCPPAPGALQGSALLFQTFAHAGLSPRMLAVCDALQRRVGAFQTVWGVKHGPNGQSWEFYFYDYDRLLRGFGMGDFIAATQGLLTVTAPPADGMPYFMFSVEINAAHLDGAPIDQIDAYIGNPGSDVSSGICYGVSAAGIEMRNFYFFFDADRHHDEIREKILCNAHVPQRAVHLPAILWPEVRSAQTIVVANKRHCDALYFSRINIDDLIYCQERLGFPEPIRRFARENRDRFAHLMFDVGYDHRPAPGGGVQAMKGSFYGLL